MSLQDQLFCPRSGQILKLNRERDALECQSSGYTRQLSGLQDLKIMKAIDMEDFFRRHAITPLVNVHTLDAGERVLQRNRQAQFISSTLHLKVVQDDHVQCPECKTIGVDFYTKQLRSADEGQTIFYECPSCGNKWKENS